MSNTVAMTVSVSPTIVQALDAYAESAGRNRSSATRELLTRALAEHAERFDVAARRFAEVSESAPELLPAAPKGGASGAAGHRSGCAVVELPPVAPAVMVTGATGGLSRKELKQ